MGPERATKTQQYDLLRPRVGQKEPPRPGSTIWYGQEWTRKSHQDPAVRFHTAKSGPERATKTRKYDLLRPRVGQKEPSRPGSYGQEWARKSHQDPAVRFVTAKSGPERATKTRQYDLLRPRVGQKEPPRPRQYDLLRPRVGQKEPPRPGSTICYDQEWARKSHQDPEMRFVTVKTRPERPTKTRQYDLLRPRVGQKEPPRPGSTICYGQEWARKSHQDPAVRFVTAKSGPERATKTRQYDLLRPRVQEWARKSHQDPAVRFVAAKSGPERATKTRQYDLVRPRMGQKEPPRPGSTICYGQEWARKSHQDPAVRFVTAKSGPERATKIRQHDLLLRFVTDKSGPERATKTRQYDLLRPRVGQKEPPRPGSAIRYGQEWARKSHQDPAKRLVTAKSGPVVTAESGPESATKTRQYDLLRPRVGQKEPLRPGSAICYGQEWARKTHQDPAVRFVTAKSGPERATKTRQYDLLRPRAGQSHQDPAVRFVTAKSGPERPTKTRQYDLLRPRVGQKEPPRPGSTICYGQEWARKSHQDPAIRFITAKSGPERATPHTPPRPGSTISYGQECKSGSERATKTRQYDLLLPRMGRKEPPRPGSTSCYGQEWARKSHQDPAVRFVTVKSGLERATKTRQYDLLQPRVGQKEPPRPGSTIYYDQEWARKSHQDPAVRFVTAKSGPEKSHQDPSSTICYGQEWARKSHQDPAVRFVTAKSGPERATKTRQYDLLRPRVGQKEPPRPGSTICYGQDWARKSHQDPAVRFITAKSGPERATKTHKAVRCITAKSGPERATKTRQYDLLRPRVGQKEPPRPGSTICYGQEWARKSHQDPAARFVTAQNGPERATKTRQYDLLWPRVDQKETRQYDLLRPRVGQKEPPTRQYDLLQPRVQDPAVRFVTAKSGPERATKTRQNDLLRPRVGQKEPPRPGSTVCYGQEWAQKEPPRPGSTICYGQE